MPLSRNAVPNLMIRVPLARVATVCGFSRHAVNPSLGARGARPCAPRSRKPAHSRNPATPLISRIVKSKSVSDAPAARAAMVYGFSRHAVNPSPGARARRPWRARSRKATHHIDPLSYRSSNLALWTWVPFRLPRDCARQGCPGAAQAAQAFPTSLPAWLGLARVLKMRSRDRGAHGRAPRAPMDGFTACLENASSIAGPGYWHRHSGRGSVWT